MDHGFDFLTDPVLVVSLDGRIVDANAAAVAFFGTTPSGGNLASLLAGGSADWPDYLRQASRSTSPRPGKLVFSKGDRTETVMTQASRSRKSTGAAVIILRLIPPMLDRFTTLDRQIKTLDTQLRERLQENVALTEALQQNKILLRELQHRVKNNIQLMMSLIRMSAERHRTPEVDAVVGTSRGRLQAMAAAQEALYRAREIDAVSAQSFLADIVRTAARAHGAADALALELDDGELNSEEAHCIALIANELVTNAAKHALQNGGHRIVVRFEKAGADYRLEVADDGPGIPPEAAKRSSGLALVRALCRQIGGRLDVVEGEGGRCLVQFQASGRRQEVP